MASSEASGPLAHARPTGSLGMESASSSRPDIGAELHTKGNSPVYRPLRKRSEAAFFKSFFAVVAVSVALVYLVFQCIRPMAFNPGSRVATRALGAGGFDDGSCAGWGEAGGAGDPSSDEDGHQEADAEPGPSQASTAAARRRRIQQPFTPGWGPRQMPPKWKERFKTVLGRIHQLATTAMTLLPSMFPEDAVQFSVQLAMVAAVELGSYAYLPDEVQPLRAEAGKAFADLLQALLDMESTRAAAINMGVDSNISNLRRFHGEIAGVPPETELFRDYRLMMISWWRTGYFTATQLLAQLNALHLEGSRNILPSARVQASCRVLDAIFNTRKGQLLRSQTMRYWFVLCHRRLQLSLMFKRKDLDEAHKKRPPSTVSPSDLVYHAIVAAGGSVISVAAPSSDLDLRSVAPIEAPPTHQALGSGPAQGPSPAVHHHPPGTLLAPPSVRPPPDFAPRVPPPPGSGPSHLPSHPSGPGQPAPPLQSQLPAPYPQGPQPSGPRPAPALQPFQQALQPGGPPDWEAQGARPRTGAAAGASAWQMEPGWGHRRMPNYWQQRMKRDLETIRTAAMTGLQLLPYLSPRQGVLLTKRLAMLAVLQLAAFAYLPDPLQPLRTGVADSYRGLIEQILAGGPTLHAATQVRDVKFLEGLHSFLGIIGTAAPPTEVMLPVKYQVKMVVQHNTCNFAYRQVMELLKQLLLAQQYPDAHITRPEVVLRALHNMYVVLKMQLLGDMALRYPFVNSHKGLKGFSLFQQPELMQAGRDKKPKMKEVLEYLQQAVRDAGATPISLDDTQTSAAPGPGQAQSSGLSHAAAQSSAAPPPPQMPQQTPFVRPPSQVGPPPGFQLLTHQAHTPPEPPQPLPFFPSLPPQPTRHPAPQYRAPTPFGQPQNPQWASPWSSPFPGGFQSVFETPAVQHGGTAGGQQPHGGPGNAEGRLGLQDLASRLSKVDIFDSEEEEDT
ncbi:hypothetical protein Emed_001382 [Eimeria media]